jgi:phosphate/sulfate permease
MLWWIIGAVVLAVGIILVVVGEADYYDDTKVILGTILIPLAGVMIFGMLIGLIVTQVTKQNDYEKVLMEREALVYQLENEDKKDVFLYSNIINFNAKIKDAKVYNANFWFNGGLLNEKIAEIDYIEIPNN